MQPAQGAMSVARGYFRLSGGPIPYHFVRFISHRLLRHADSPFATYHAYTEGYSTEYPRLLRTLSAYCFTTPLSSLLCTCLSHTIPCGLPFPSPHACEIHAIAAKCMNHTTYI